MRFCKVLSNWIYMTEIVKLNIINLIDYLTVMKKLDLFIRRQIALFLNAHDKIKVMALLSKKWNEFVYSGFAW